MGHQESAPIGLAAKPTDRRFENMTVRHMLLYALPLAAIALLVAVMANGPLYRTYSFEECRLAYAGAMSRDDTARVDLHPYRPDRDNRRVKHRCGEIRALVATDAVPQLPANR